MNKFYNEFFYVPRYGKGKVGEKVMIARIALSVVLVLVCMAAMSFTAYAYFSQTLIANMGVIRSATWDIVVTAEDDVVMTNHTDGDYYILNNSSDKVREFTITVAKNETETSATVGYAKIDVQTDVGEYTYYTQPIGEYLVGDEMTVCLEREIIVVVPAGKVAHVRFIGEWGTCAEQSIVDRVIEPVFDTTSGSSAEIDETTGTTTTDTTTVATTTVPQETTTTTQPTTTTEPATQTTEPAATDTPSTEATTETQPATETTETTGAPTTEASE